MTDNNTPDWIMSITPEELGRDSGVEVTIVPDEEELYLHFARAMVDTIEKNTATGKPTSFILPVGPVGQYTPFAKMVRENGVNLSELSLFFMDEYLTDDDEYIPESHPLSFRGFVKTAVVEPLAGHPGWDPRRVHFPDPKKPDEYTRMISDAGGIDIAFAGVGISGHLAFNEPPEPGETVSKDEFIKRRTRVLSLSRETKTINSVTAAGGGIFYIPSRAVTVGMYEIFSADKIMVYMNRFWQKAVIRRMLHGEVTAAFPASLVRTRGAVSVTATEEVSRPPLPTLR
ncbi:MAG: glucosamine-6-phosphate isomerase [Deltaproteobacteria bacterium]|nr:glucosamine-6-phosphate isomerase [Candidatus Zymogenaceae bacterium]